MSKFSFHNTFIIPGGMRQTFVMDDFGNLARIHWNRVNTFLSQIH